MTGMEVLPIKLSMQVDSAGFLHPATMVGPREITLMRQRVRAGERGRAMEHLLKSTPLEVQHHALKVLHMDYNGKGQGHKEFVEWDGVQAYSQTIAWLCTGNERYAQNAAKIIDAWSTTCTEFTGQNAPLVAGWGGTSMLRALELLKYTWPGFTPELFDRFMAFMDRLIMVPTCIGQREYQGWKFKNNWHSTIAELKAQLAVMRGDKALWQAALKQAQEVMDFYLHKTGECHETSRDLYHSQFGLGSLLQICELAWQQGIELYSHGDYALVTCMELHASINNGEKPCCCDYELKGVGFQPTWEIGYNHFHGRLRIPMPQTEKLLAKHRPEKYIFQWGLGTLTHRDSAQRLYPHPGKGNCPPTPPTHAVQQDLPAPPATPPTPSPRKEEL